MAIQLDWRYCPWCGGSHFEPRAGLSWHCRDCGRVYYRNTAAAAAALIEVDDRIIVAVRAREPGQGLLDLPGGFINPDETAEQALLREVKEELNLDLAELRFLTTAPNRYLYQGVEYPGLDLVFVCRAARLDALQAQDDVAGVRLLRPQELDLDQFAFVSTKAALRYYLRQLTGC